MASGNGFSPSVRSLLHHRTGTTEQWRTTLGPVAESILARLGLSADEFGVLVLWEKHRPRAHQVLDDPAAVRTPEEDRVLDQATASYAAVAVSDQQAMDAFLVAQAKVKDYLRVGREPPARLAEDLKVKRQVWLDARAMLDRAVVARTEAELRRNHARLTKLYG